MTTTGTGNRRITRYGEQFILLALIAVGAAAKYDDSGEKLAFYVSQLADGSLQGLLSSGFAMLLKAVEMENRYGAKEQGMQNLKSQKKLA